MVEATQGIKVIIGLEIESLRMVSISIDHGKLSRVIEGDPDIDGNRNRLGSWRIYLLHQGGDGTAKVDEQRRVAQLGVDVFPSFHLEAEVLAVVDSQKLAHVVVDGFLIDILRLDHLVEPVGHQGRHTHESHWSGVVGRKRETDKSKVMVTTIRRQSSN